MALRAEIVIIDDDENIPNVVKVPMYKCPEGELGVFAENMVIDPDTGDVYKFTFQADVVGQIAPKREEPEVPRVGDFVRVIANSSGHHFNREALAEVEKVWDDRETIDVVGVGKRGSSINQTLLRADYILE